MKKIIKGKVYDISTAKKLATYSCATAAVSDHQWYQEILFIKITGEYFIYGEGNAASPYGEKVEQHSSRPGARIRPITITQAQEWAEERLDTDEYEAIFNLPQDDKVQIATWIPAAVKAKSDALDATLSEIFSAGVDALSKTD